MRQVTIRVVDAPVEPGVELVLQRKGPKKAEIHEPSPDLTWRVEWDEKDGKGKGDAIYRYGDGRDFIYLSWLRHGRMFKRIKLYTSQIEGEEVVIQGTGKDGTHACSTARVLPS
jgi:hypothetical protein